MYNMVKNLYDYEYPVPKDPPWWLSIVWRRPRIDFSFHLNNATWQSLFKLPVDNTYAESTFFYTAIPVLWLLFTLLVFLAYFCYRCCQRDVEKKKKVPCTRFSLVFFSVFICLIALLGIFANQFIYSGFSSLETVMNSQIQYSNDIENKITTKSNLYKSIHIENSGFIINLLKNEDKISDDTKVEMIKQAKYLNDVSKDVRSKLQIVSQLYSANYYIEKMSFILQNYVEFSWISLMCYLIFIVFISVLLIFGVIFSSKCTLLVYCSLAMLIMVLCYMISSYLISIIIISSDVCMSSPEKILSGVLLYIPLSYNRDQDLTNFGCRPYGLANLTYISEHVNFTRQSIASLESAIDDDQAFKSHVTSDRFRSYKQLINNCKAVDAEPWATNLTSTLSSFCDLSTVRMERISESVCALIVPGYDLLAICLLTFGLLLTLTSIIASRAWRNFGSNKRMFSHHASAPDENDYLMYGDEYPSQQYSFSRGRQGNPREHISMQQRRNTPPPAYKALNQQQQQQQHQPGPHTSQEITPLEPVPPTPEHHRRYAAMGYARETDA